MSTYCTAQGTNYTQNFVTTCKGKESEKEYMCVCISCTPETNTTL